jgi:hypothetical protein
MVVLVAIVLLVVAAPVQVVLLAAAAAVAAAAVLAGQLVDLERAAAAVRVAMAVMVQHARLTA